MTTATDRSKPSPKVPRWLVRTIWATHRFALRVTGGRWGLREPATGRWGMLRLTTTGRRSGRRRVAILGYIDDGPNLLVPAMNGWADPEPAWWLNLLAIPEAEVVLPDGRSLAVVARAAGDGEREALWARFVALDTAAYTDANAALRTRPTQIAVLEPRATSGGNP